MANNRKIVVTLLGIMLSAVAYCQSDFEIAQSFMSRKGITLNPKASTRGGDASSIFTGIDGKGFVIVKDGAVVGYSTTNTATECLVRANTRSYTLTPKTPIDPIVVAEWGQSYPFNWQTPIVENGRNAPAGCGPVALGELCLTRSWRRGDRFCLQGTTLPGRMVIGTSLTGVMTQADTILISAIMVMEMVSTSSLRRSIRKTRIIEVRCLAGYGLQFQLCRRVGQ